MDNKNIINNIEYMRVITLFLFLLSLTKILSSKSEISLSPTTGLSYLHRHVDWPNLESRLLKYLIQARTYFNIRYKIIINVEESSIFNDT